MNAQPAPTQRTRPRTPNNRTTTGFRISDELWAVLEPLIPVRVNTHRFGGGRPRTARGEAKGTHPGALHRRALPLSACHMAGPRPLRLQPPHIHIQDIFH